MVVLVGPTPSMQSDQLCSIGADTTSATSLSLSIYNKLLYGILTFYIPIKHKENLYCINLLHNCHKENLHSINVTTVPIYHKEKLLQHMFEHILNHQKNSKISIDYRKNAFLK